MKKPEAFSFHRFDRQMPDWDKAHWEFLQKLGKTFHRHSKRMTKFQLYQESLSLDDLARGFSVFFLVPLKTFPSQFIVLHFPHEFWDLFVNLLNGGQLKYQGSPREMTVMDESTLRPMIGDLLNDLEGCSAKSLSFLLDKCKRENSVESLRIRLGDQKLKKFEVTVEIESQVKVTFSILYPYSTLSALG